MKIALVGRNRGHRTGFAVRWAENHEIIIGSRKADKARAPDSAAKLEQKGNVWGTDNGSAIAASDAVVLCVPFEAFLVTGEMKLLLNQIVISPVVPELWPVLSILLLGERRCPQVRSLLPESIRIVAPFTPSAPPPCRPEHLRLMPPLRR